MADPDPKPTSTHKSTEPDPVVSISYDGAPPAPLDPTPIGSEPASIEIDAFTGEKRPFELPLPSPDAVIVPAGAKTRPWHDFGLDTGPRLRVKGLEPLPGPPPAVADDTGDPAEWRERHRKYKQAREDGDDHALSKLMPDVLDSLHSGEQKPKCPPFSWPDLETAFLAELREWGRANKIPKRMLGFQRFFDGSSAVRVPVGGNLYEIRIDKRSAVVAWAEAGGNPRRAAGILGLRVAGEFASARIREVIEVPEPEAGN